MREKVSICRAQSTPEAYGGTAPAPNHLSIARRSALTDYRAAKTLLFEVPLGMSGISIWMCQNLFDLNLQMLKDLIDHCSLLLA
ncbi:MAG: hypothetical protein HY244_10875 [Rhizobiales bacterium]|nr:hypothetical protein [Hyphomicrobiales bacterium]